MKRTTAAAIGLVVILACALVGSAQAGKPGAFARYTYSGKAVVEQQSALGWSPNDCAPVETVCNQTSPRAIWDIDDVYNVSFGGTLRPGESISLSLPIVIDTLGHLLAIDSTLPATVEVEGIVSSTRCLVGPDFDSGANLPPAPNPDGGIGWLRTVTWTVTNDESRPRQFGAFGYAVPASSGWVNTLCPSGWNWADWPRGGQVPAYTAPTWWIDE